MLIIYCLTAMLIICFLADRQTCPLQSNSTFDYFSRHLKMPWLNMIQDTLLHKISPLFQALLFPGNWSYERDVIDLNSDEPQEPKAKGPITSHMRRMDQEWATALQVSIIKYSVWLWTDTDWWEVQMSPVMLKDHASFTWTGTVRHMTTFSVFEFFAVSCQTVLTTYLLFERIKNIVIIEHF